MKKKQEKMREFIQRNMSERRINHTSNKKKQRREKGEDIVWKESKMIIFMNSGKTGKLSIIA